MSHRRSVIIEQTGCKILLVGDSRCGKSSLLKVFVKESFTEVYVPTIFDNSTASFEVEKYRIDLSLWDTSGCTEYDNVRPLSYTETDCVVVCYDISVPESLDNVVDKWFPEVRRCGSAGIPIILVGCKMDLRNDIHTITELAQKRQITLTHEKGIQVAKQIGAAAFVECSAKNSRSSVNELFEIATLSSLGKLSLHKSLKGLPSHTRSLSFRRKKSTGDLTHHKLRVKSTVLQTSTDSSKLNKSCVVM
ncbi:rho-related GTP-binding protein RhoN-like [Saccoglossus kowalevskii]|uniref:Rho-related GTP-binding protein RhoN-like n=1 Tax=Saccoglossus kowalevskii TaxID=10224 RepID=A0ABM0MM29_SACKO|nr:PREDICTED: rho-related GTP-binding protein RhoN-like [Saccoglossus kowalevskii]